MEITNTIQYKLCFSVHYFEDGEGGMDTEQFGKDVYSLKEAVRLWEVADTTRPEHQWEIVSSVTRVVK